MKGLLIVALMLVSGLGFGQVFYVEPTEKGYEKEISNKLDFSGFKVVNTPSESTHTITYHYQKNNKNKKFEAYIKVSKTDSKEEVYRTTVVKKAASAFNGYQALPTIISDLTEKQLLPQLRNATSLTSKNG